MVSEIRVSTVVMAHPDRKHQAEQLRRRHPDLNIQIVLDPEPDGAPATLRTAKLAWNTVREGATHQLVLQEDVQLCNGFGAVLNQALQVAPEGAIALHNSWQMATAQAVRLAAFAGASWTPVIDPMVPTQALVIPAALARQFAAYAERYGPHKPDNWAMMEFLRDHGLKTYVAVPNLAEHRPAESLLLNDLFYGIRRSVVFPLGKAVNFTDSVALPPAVAHMGLGDFESTCHFEPLGRDERTIMNVNEVMFPAGMTTLILGEAFASDLDYHPEAVRTGFGSSMLFQFWLTSFIQGIVGRGMVGPADATTFDKQLDTAPWARPALETFAAGALRKTCRPEMILDTAAQITPLCIKGMRSGFAAVDHWPGLRALWDPHSNTMRPRWNAGNKEDDAK